MEGHDFQPCRFKQSPTQIHTINTIVHNSLFLPWHESSFPIFTPSVSFNSFLPPFHILFRFFLSSPPTHSPPINVLAKPFPTSAQRILRSYSLTSVFATKAKIGTRGISKRVYTLFFSNFIFTVFMCINISLFKKDLKKKFKTFLMIYLPNIFQISSTFFPTRRGLSIQIFFYFFLYPFCSQV